MLAEHIQEVPSASPEQYQIHRPQAVATFVPESIRLFHKAYFDLHHPKPPKELPIQAPRYESEIDPLEGLTDETYWLSNGYTLPRMTDNGFEPGEVAIDAFTQKILNQDILHEEIYEERLMRHIQVNQLWEGKHPLYGEVTPEGNTKIEADVVSYDDEWGCYVSVKGPKRELPKEIFVTDIFVAQNANQLVQSSAA